MAKTLNVRLPAELHEQLAAEAERQGVSLNTLIITALSWWMDPRTHVR